MASRQVQQRCSVTKDSIKELNTETAKLLRLGWETEGKVQSALSGSRWVKVEGGPNDDEYGNYEKVKYPQYTQHFARYKQ